LFILAVEARFAPAAHSYASFPLPLAVLFFLACSTGIEAGAIGLLGTGRMQSCFPYQRHEQQLIALTAEFYL
jgi:hypothetical protein